MLMNQRLVLLDEDIRFLEVVLELFDALKESGAVFNGIHLWEEGGGGMVTMILGH